MSTVTMIGYMSNFHFGEIKKGKVQANRLLFYTEQDIISIFGPKPQLRCTKIKITLQEEDK